MGLIARVLPAGKRTMGVSMHSLVNRIPMALGPVLGGFCIAAWGERDGVRWAFGLALAFAVLAIALQQRLLDEAAGERPAAVPAAGATPRALYRMMSPALKNLLISDYLIRDIVVSVAAFGGAFLWEVSPQTNFLGAFVFGVMGTVYYAVWGSDERSLKLEADRAESKAD
jgi:MFS family permease